MSGVHLSHENYQSGIDEIKLSVFSRYGTGTAFNFQVNESDEMNLINLLSTKRNLCVE